MQRSISFAASFLLLLLPLNKVAGLVRLRLHQLRVRTDCCLYDSTAIKDRNDWNAFQSLQSGRWVKFISGASNQDLPLIRNLCFLYTLAGVDCIDVSADVAVIEAARNGINNALAYYSTSDKLNKPLLMISVNDDEDLHFRKAYFDSTRCPTDCPRPCEKVCPAWAIPSLQQLQNQLHQQQQQYPIENGVVEEKCYGCGRCIPVCPHGLVEAISYNVSASDIVRILSTGVVDAIEIHTQPHHAIAFSELWQQIGRTALTHLKAVAVSFPDMGHDTLPYLNTLQDTMTAMYPNEYASFVGFHIWQADGRPMSGDISRGTAHAATEFALRLLDAAAITTATAVSTTAATKTTAVNGTMKQQQQLDGSNSNATATATATASPLDCSTIAAHSTTTAASGTTITRATAAIDSNRINFSAGRHFVQLAGGTNDYSSTTAAAVGLQQRDGFGGFAFGGFARKTLNSKLNALQQQQPGANVEDHDSLFTDCLRFARALVQTVK